MCVYEKKKIVKKIVKLYPSFQASKMIKVVTFEEELNNHIHFFKRNETGFL